MTLMSQGKPSRKRSVWGHNLTTATEDVYVCPPNCTAELSYLHIHNSTGNTDIKVEWYVAADAYTSHFIEGKNLGVGEYVAFTNLELILQAGDKLQITPTHAAHIDTLLTVTETFKPVG
jgi:hypothetical protein